MKRIIAVVLAVVTVALFAACGQANEPTEAPASAPTEAVAEAAESKAGLSAEQIKAVGERIDDLLFERDCSAAVYMVYGGEEVYSSGRGKADKDTGTENSADVVYQIASVTKQFTAAAVLKLCGEGRLSLDDTLSMYLPDYAAGAQITLLNLLTMQSGIPDFVRDYDENGFEQEVRSYIEVTGISENNTAEENRAALREYIYSLPLLFEQGERYSYCNSNYFLLGEVVEKVSGMSCHEYIRKEFFEPLGMSTAGFIGDYDIPGATLAKGYHHVGGAEILSYKGVAFGCADIMASPKDIYKWTVALHSGKVLSDEMYSIMTTPYAEAADMGDGVYYGCGLFITEQYGIKMYMHPGSIPCFTSVAAYVPQLDLCLCMMSNYAYERMVQAGLDVCKVFLTEAGLMPEKLSGK